MATDLETKADQGEVPLSRPSLKIVGLHIRGLKSIKTLDLPEDGLGWNGPIPDFVMVGGINGSGKTTLLEFLATSSEQLGRPTSFEFKKVPLELRAEEARIDLHFSIPDLIDERFRFLIGDKSFLDANGKDSWFGFEYHPTIRPAGRFQFGYPDHKLSNSRTFLFEGKKSSVYSSPAVVYFPSEGRTLISPETRYKFAGKLSERTEFVYRWHPPREWPDSLDARLYAIRWDYLNAKEEGRDQEANGFEAYSEAFNRFFEGRKRLKWHRAELVVETKGGDIHDLSELSSGEKQVILFMGELLHRWRPGSLILIDEPELHLHESYQTKLWESLIHWQKERGGQVIVATQSDHLFGLSGPGTRVLLSRQSL
jgi:predicted ATPase